MSAPLATSVWEWVGDNRGFDHVATFVKFPTPGAAFYVKSPEWDEKCSLCKSWIPHYMGITEGQRSVAAVIPSLLCTEGSRAYK